MGHKRRQCSTPETCSKLNFHQPICDISRQSLLAAGARPVRSVPNIATRRIETERAFVRGYAQCLADFWRHHHDRSALQITFRESGLTILELEASGVEAFDLDAIKEALK